MWCEFGWWNALVAQQFRYFRCRFSYLYAWQTVHRRFLFEQNERIWLPTYSTSSEVVSIRTSSFISRQNWTPWAFKMWYKFLTAVPFLVHVHVTLCALGGIFSNAMFPGWWWITKPLPSNILVRVRFQIFIVWRWIWRHRIIMVQGCHFPCQGFIKTQISKAITAVTSRINWKCISWDTIIDWKTILQFDFRSTVDTGPFSCVFGQRSDTIWNKCVVKGRVMVACLCLCISIQSSSHGRKLQLSLSFVPNVVGSGCWIRCSRTRGSTPWTWKKMIVRYCDYSPVRRTFKL